MATKVFKIKKNTYFSYFSMYMYLTTCLTILIKALLRAWKVLGRHYLKSGNSLDETRREEISQPVVKN